MLSAPDGSWCAVREDAQDGMRHVSEAGPTKLWTVIEHTHRLWTSLGEPDWDSFGLTVMQDRQWAWLDHPGGPNAWPLPDGTARGAQRP